MSTKELPKEGLYISTKVDGAKWFVEAVHTYDLRPLKQYFKSAASDDFSYDVEVVEVDAKGNRLGIELELMTHEWLEFVEEWGLIHHSVTDTVCQQG